jgi:DNA (cytosine-5)-methyltransferase 1
MNHLDLFSGIGGFALAAKWAGFDTIQFCEKDKFCQKVLAKNFPLIPIHDDIKTFEYTKPVTIITGGFPCQPFSIAGKQKGVKDDRYLWPEFLRIIKQSKPIWIIAENVTGIVEMELDNITHDLDNEGYETQTFIIPASAAKAPHRRERIWIVAYARSIGCVLRPDCITTRTCQCDFYRNIEKAQKIWSHLQYESWQTFKYKDWFRLTPHAYSEQRGKRAANQDTFTKRFERTELDGEALFNSAAFKGEEGQPPLPGVDDGLPFGVDRNRSLGNAIVPQVVYPILKTIYEIEMLKGTA